MHPKTTPRRVHDAQLKASVLAACDEPGASISAVALAYGLNANLVRKWRHGRGLKRAGLAASLAVTPTAMAVSPEAVAARALLAADASFLPVEMLGPAATGTGTAIGADATAAREANIDIELKRGDDYLRTLLIQGERPAAPPCSAGDGA